MPRRSNFRLVVALYLVAFTVQTGTSIAQESASQKPHFDVGLTIFIRDGDPRSDQAKDLLKKAAERKGVKLTILDLQHSGNRSYLKSVVDKFDVKHTPAPIVYGCNRLVYGFDENFPAKIDEMIRVDVFIGKDCKVCPDAVAYMKAGFQKKYPGMIVRQFDTSEDKVAMDWVQASAKKTGHDVKLPAFYLCGELVMGWEGNKSEVQLDAILKKWTQVAAGGTDPRQ